MNFSMKDFFSKRDQIRKLRIWSHLPKESLIKNFIFSVVIHSTLAIAFFIKFSLKNQR